MYEQNYENYMNSVFGNPNMMQIPGQMTTYSGMDNYHMNNNGMMNNPYMQQQMMPQRATHNVDSVEKMYPEMYHMVYPMVVKKCEKINMPITEDLINQLTDEVYLAIEVTETEKKVEMKTDMQMNKRTPINEVKQNDTRHHKNNHLRDLIRILFLRQLIDRRFPGHNHDHKYKPNWNKNYYNPGYMY